jgi:hypothetical protein
MLYTSYAIDFEASGNKHIGKSSEIRAIKHIS